jgi:hypothetical protein
MILLTILYGYRYAILKKQHDSLIKYQEIYCEKTALLLEIAKLTIFSVNKLKNPLTSLSIILDEFREPALINNKKTIDQYLKKADQLFRKIRQKDNILYRQLFPQNIERLFDLKQEIEEILIFYKEIFQENGILVEFKSDHEYRIFAQQDQLLRIINSILLTSLQSLIASNKKFKKIKIYFIRTAYLLKIMIEDNAGTINKSSLNGLIKLNCLKNNEVNEFQLSLYFANKMMKKHFRKKIEILNEKESKTVICLKIRNSSILAEPKL